MGLLGTLKLIFVFLVSKKAVQGKNFTGKTEKFTGKILQEKRQGKNEKIKKTSD